MRMNKTVLRVLCSLMIILLAVPLCGTAEEGASTRWADAADEIDKYLDAAFEAYLDGDPETAYSNVSNAYFRVYETTGFERQTMSYISGNRKNAVEMQFSACKERKRNHRNQNCRAQRAGKAEDDDPRGRKQAGCHAGRRSE